MLLLIDKPKGITSHDVVYRVRKITGERRVGHAGTLDPNATGLLVIGVGREFTKKLGTITKETTKEYIAEVFLGESRDTDDSEGVVVSTNVEVVPNKAAVNQVVNALIGDHMQSPPVYSAIKIKGKKSYELARRGKPPILEPRPVTVLEAEVLEYSYPKLSIRFLVSSGTYIRSLARDIGETLGTYGYLKELRRTKIGEYTISDASTLEELQSRLSRETTVS